MKPEDFHTMHNALLSAVSATRQAVSYANSAFNTAKSSHLAAQAALDLFVKTHGSETPADVETAPARAPEPGWVVVRETRQPVSRQGGSVRVILRQYARSVAGTDIRWVHDRAQATRYSEILASRLAQYMIGHPDFNRPFASQD